jgi:hypothetical protein
MKTLPLSLTILCLACTAAALAQDVDAPFCQILDRYDDEPIWYARTGYIVHEDVDEPGGKDFGILDLEAGTGLAYFQTSRATIDVRAAVDAMVFLGSGGIDLPDQVGFLGFDINWTRRNARGGAFQFSTQPGLYSDFEDISGNDVSFPLGFAWIRSISPQLSLQTGLRVFPGFDREVDPKLGVRWSPDDFWIIDLFYPESRVGFAPNPDWRFFLGWERLVYPEYQLSGDPRDRFQVDEDRLYLALQHAVSDTTHLLFEIGKKRNREYDFERRAPGADIDDALYFSLGLGSFL